MTMTEVVNLLGIKDRNHVLGVAVNFMKLILNLQKEEEGSDISEPQNMSIKIRIKTKK